MSTASAVVAVPITLDRPRHLKLTMGALRRAEVRLRKVRENPDLSINQVIGDFVTKQRIGADALVVLLHQGFLHEDPTLAESAVEDMLTFLTQTLALDAIMQALAGQLVQPQSSPEESPGGAAPAGNPSTGSGSGPSDATTSGSAATSSGS